MVRQARGVYLCNIRKHHVHVTQNRQLSYEPKQATPLTETYFSFLPPFLFDFDAIFYQKLPQNCPFFQPFQP